MAHYFCCETYHIVSIDLFARGSRHHVYLSVYKTEFIDTVSDCEASTELLGHLFLKRGQVPFVLEAFGSEWRHAQSFEDALECISAEYEKATQEEAEDAIGELIERSLDHGNPAAGFRRVGML